MEIGEFGVGRPDFGGRRPRGEALGKKEKGLGARQDGRGLEDRQERLHRRRTLGAARISGDGGQEGRHLAKKKFPSAFNA